jgi:hypothetical protein
MTMNLLKVRPADAGRTAAGVPWLTVLPLAALLAYVDGYWMMSLRGVVGAVRRNEHPFSSWWRESTAVLPMFVLAVLVAFILARRWFGPLARTAREVTVTAALTFGLASIVGLANIAVNAAYDYHLEVNDLQMMRSMGTTAEHAEPGVQVHAVLFVSRWVLLTNLALVGWLVAMRGGRIVLAAPRRLHTFDVDSRVLCGAAVFAAAGIHAVVAQRLVGSWPLAGAGTMLFAGAELFIAGALLARLEGRRAMIAAALACLGSVAFWLFGHTGGTPFGPRVGVPAGIAVASVAVAALEFGILVSLLVLLRHGPEPHTGRALVAAPVPAYLAGAVWVAILAALTLAAAGLASTVLVR